MLRTISSFVTSKLVFTGNDNIEGVGDGNMVGSGNVNDKVNVVDKVNMGFSVFRMGFFIPGAKLMIV